MTSIQTRLPLTSTTIRPRGRRTKPLSVSLLGAERTPGLMDTTGLRGVPLEHLVMLAAERGHDPSEALAIGINTLEVTRVKATAPAFSRQVTERLHITDAQDARLVAMHIQKAAKGMKRKPEDILAAIELMGA